MQDFQNESEEFVRHRSDDSSGSVSPTEQRGIGHPDDTAVHLESEVEAAEASQEIDEDTELEKELAQTTISVRRNFHSLKGKNPRSRTNNAARDSSSKPQGVVKGKSSQPAPLVQAEDSSRPETTRTSVRRKW